MSRSIQYSFGEELANAITHGVAALLSVAGLAVLVGFAVAHQASALTITSVSIFGASMFVLYLASTLYHAVTKDNVKRVLRVIDHASIFLLIAGSYTPFCLVTLKDFGGVWLCAAVWTIAIIGMAFQYRLIQSAKWISLSLYLLMGWLIVFMAGDLTANLPSGGLWLLLAGGLSYTVGVFFYVRKNTPYSHAVWHVFVFAGTVLQFLSVLLYVI